MRLKYTGRAIFANGRAASGVVVRVFDGDEPGKGDDDLTVEPGISDRSGHFAMRYSPSRYLDSEVIPPGEQLSHLFDWAAEGSAIRMPDLSDGFRPYLQLRYTLAGLERIETVPFSPFRTEIRLQEVLPLDFLPSQHGFRFINSFPGSPLPFNIPCLPAIGKVSSVYGLCGGMASAAYDFYLAGLGIPDQDKDTVVPPPKKRTKLHSYLYRRLIDSFGFGVPIVKLAKWMTMVERDPAGIQKRTYDEFEFGDGDHPSIRARLDAQEAVQLALLYEKANSGKEVIQRIWDNHQVLATGYRDLPGGDIEIRIYDPNYPLNDSVVISAHRVTVGNQAGLGDPSTPKYGYKPMQKIGQRLVREVHGFLSMPYAFVEPTGLGRSPMLTG